MTGGNPVERGNQPMTGSGDQIVKVAAPFFTPRLRSG
jgi:hypothetical protein